MSGGSGIAGRVPEARGDDALLLSDDMAEELVTDEAPPPSLVDRIVEQDAEGHRAGWVWPTLAILAAIAWFAGMGWLLAPSFQRGLPPVELVQIIAALCVPPALLGILWMLGQRTSRREARRFAATSAAMRNEAALLERVVKELSQRIEANRAELSEQTKALMAMGDHAAERLQAVSNGMAQEAKAIDASAQRLGEAAASAEKNVGVVLAALPRAQETITAAAGILDSTGLKAAEHASALDAQLSALAERGREADTIAGGAAQRLAAHITRMEATSETAGARLEAVAGEMSTTVDAMLDRTAAAVDEARKGIAAQGDAMLAMLNTNQAALDRAGKDSVETLGERIATIEETLSRIADRIGEQTSTADQMMAALRTGVDAIDTRFGEFHAAGMQRTQDLSASISALAGTADAMAETMRVGEDLARGVIGTAEELLTALDASAREIDETLPEALARLDARIAESRGVVAGAKPELLALVTAAESTHDAIEAIAEVVSKQRDTLAKTQASLLETLDSGHDKAAALGGIVDSTITTTRRFAEEAAPELVQALLRVRETATQAQAHAREALGAIVPEASRALEMASGDALNRAVDTTVRAKLVELSETSDAAVAAATAASEKLTQKMLEIADAIARTEARIEEAQAQREESDRDNFARRVSLLIEAMNSASIDLSKAFAQDVSDSAWSAYLKGDRGVFTRRAVRLLDAGQSREIASLYDGDSAFREQVNRYIHDFEAMLRQILALRDGSPLGVTLLSSDMGKLYVALAQAIERLRT